MFRSTKPLIFIIVALGIILAKERGPQLISTQEDRVQTNTTQTRMISPTDTQPQSREEIILFEIDFEGDVSGWEIGNPSGWELTESDSYSPTHSFNSPDANDSGEWESYDLFSEPIEIPPLGDDELMHFKFAINCDMPDFIQEDDPETEDDESQYLADYYGISLMDPSALAWHQTDFNSNDGNSYWAADESVGGYLDSWIQYLDTPAISVGSNGVLNATIFYAIEDPAGADGAIAGSCTNGWDAANIRISSDGGATWELLVDSSNPYHFSCGYGWIYNNTDYEADGPLNHLAPGWGGMSDDGHGGGWLDFSADLSAYENQDVIVRFAFGSDPAYSTPDEPAITGFQVDDVSISDASGELFSDNADGEQLMTPSGEVWVSQFYDYGDASSGQPGSQGWEEYLPGMPFNGNAFMDISEYAGNTIVFRFQSYYDGDFYSEDSTVVNPAQGTGLFIDDFVIYKISSGSYAPPTGLTAESGDSQITLSWQDMNTFGTSDFIWDNDAFSNGISMISETATGYAGASFEFGAPATVNSVDIFHLAFDDSLEQVDFDMEVCIFGTIGTLFDSEAAHDCIVINTATFVDGWNTINTGGWSMPGSFIIAHTFNSGYAASLDESASGEHSYFNYLQTNGSLSSWDGELSSDGSFEGEWGIRANVSFESANVTYNVYTDGDPTASGLTNNSFIVTGLTNNITYEFAVSATYPDGEESSAATVSATPFSDTVYESAYDDGSAEMQFNVGSGNQSAVSFTACSEGEDLFRFKWYQFGDGGAFYLKIWDDNNGEPGVELHSEVVASGLVSGWNERDVLDEGLNLSGDFWIGTQEFSSSQPFGLDTDSESENSFENLDGSWATIAGNLMYRVLLDGAACGDCANDLGDVNVDGAINVLDVVGTVNHILGNNLLEGCGLVAADFNQDEAINVLDIVGIVNYILGPRQADASSAELIWSNISLSVKADGYIGGVQMTLHHDEGFEIQLTEDVLVADYKTEGTETKLVIVAPETELLFHYSGDFEITEIIVANSSAEVKLTLPGEFELSPAFPNPFNPSTSFHLHVAEAGIVSVNIYNITGRIVGELMNGYQDKGIYSLTWDAGNNASGLYLVRAESLDRVAVQKILLLK